MLNILWFYFVRLFSCRIEFDDQIEWVFSSQSQPAISAIDLWSIPVYFSMATKAVINWMLIPVTNKSAREISRWTDQKFGGAVALQFKQWRPRAIHHSKWTADSKCRWEGIIPLDCWVIHFAAELVVVNLAELLANDQQKQNVGA